MSLLYGNLITYSTRDLMMHVHYIRIRLSLHLASAVLLVFSQVTQTKICTQNNEISSHYFILTFTKLTNVHTIKS